MQTRPPLRHPQLEDDMYAARWSIIAQRNSLVVVVKTEKYAIIINLGIKLQLYSVPVSNTNKLSSSLASLFSFQIWSRPFKKSSGLSSILQVAKGSDLLFPRISIMNQAERYMSEEDVEYEGRFAEYDPGAAENQEVEVRWKANCECVC